MTFKLNTIQDFSTTRDAQRCSKQIQARVEGASLFAPAFVAPTAAPSLTAAAAM